MVARQAIEEGATVVIAGRSKERIQQAQESLGSPQVEAIAADIGDRTQVERLFAQVGEQDHLVVTAATLPYGPIVDLREQDLMPAIRSKFLGPIFAVQLAVKSLCSRGSITFTSGIAARRPVRGGATAAAIDGAVEGLTRALALELAPIRVNAVSPGWVDSPVWDKMPGVTAERKKERFSEMAARLPARHIGRPEEIAAAFLFLMKNEFATGTILHLNGGHELV
jgi:NAD(P)-dependent dehydrogenase (short-subunit alcohol dehydrogenase family)